MKKYISLLAVIVFTLGLAACSTQSSLTQAISPFASNTSQSQTTAAELAAGTLKLQDTDNAVTGGQASELLTLWLAYKEVSTSDYSTQMEKEALVTQISESMTDSQLSAIEAMNLTEVDIQNLAESIGIASSAASTPSTANTSGNSNSGMGRGLGGGDMAGGGDLTGSDMVSMGNASAAATGSVSTGIPTSDTLILDLLDPLTQMLEETAA